MKRDHDSAPGESSVDAKRFRPEEILGSVGDDRVITRLLMPRLDFSKLIGKGGATISHIRANSGVNVRGTNVDEEFRLVLLSGPFQNVMRAFDMITEILNQSNQADSHIIQINMLLEHNKAGKIVGAKGTMIQNIQAKSGCVTTRIEKMPKEYSGVSLRKLCIEGVISAIRRAHFIVHELYASEGNYGMQQMGTRNAGFGMGNDVHIGGGGQGYGDSDGGLPFPSLVSYGVQPETVGQLSDMKTYLSRHFGLNLMIVKEGSMYKTAPSFSVEKLTLEETIEQKKQKSAPYQEMCFGIPKNAVGGVIGKSGSILKELQAEFGIRIHVEKEDFSGKRLVVMNSSSDGQHTDNEAKLSAFLRCQSKILTLVDQQLAEAASGLEAQDMIDPSSTDGEAIN